MSRHGYHLSLVGALWMLSGCGADEYTVQWRVLLPQATQSGAIARIGVSILDGGCDGSRTLYQSVISGTDTTAPPPRLSAGMYGFRVEVYDHACGLMAGACIEHALPIEASGSVLEIALEAQPAPYVSCGEASGQGVCTPGLCEIATNPENMLPFAPQSGGVLEIVPFDQREVPLRLVAGHSHVCALTSVGRVFCWGRNAEGQTGLGDGPRVLEPTLIEEIDEAVSLAAGEHHTCAVVASGAVWCWGDGSHGQIARADGTLDHAYRPVELTGIPPAIAVAGRGNHTCVTHTSGLTCWGANDFGQVGSGSVSPIAPPTAVDLPGIPRLVAAGLNHTCAVLDDADLYCWGSNANAQSGPEGEDIYLTPTAQAWPGAPVMRLIASGDHNCAIDLDGDTYCWGANARNMLAQNEAPVRIFGPGAFEFDKPLRSISISNNLFTCEVTDEGGAYCQGNNGLGQLGTGDNHNRRNPNRINPELFPEGRVPVSVTLGRTFACWLLDDGAFSCQGTNSGNFGDGSTQSSSTPTPGIKAW